MNTTTQNVIVLLGKQRYRLCTNWISAKESVGVSSVAVLTDGRLAVLLRGQPAKLRLFDTDAQQVDEWELPQIRCAHKLTALPGGGVLVCDVDGHQLYAFDSKGQALWRLGDPSTPNWQAPFNHPTHATFTHDGRLYVTDGYGNSCVHEFDADLNWVNTFKGASEVPLFTVPHSIVHEGTDLYVADRENSRVVVLNEAGEIQRLIGPVYKPMSVALHPSGNLLVSDQTASLSLFTLAGELLGRCRTTAVYGHSISCNQAGHIFMAEMMPDRVSCLVPIF